LEVKVLYLRMTADRAKAAAASVAWMKAEPDTLMARVLAPANLKRAISA
jgi:RNA-directed DNA polymerase